MDAVDAVCSGCSGIVVYDIGNIVFGAERSNQWKSVDAVHSRIVVYGGWDIVFDAVEKKGQTSGQWTQYTVDAVRSGIVVYGGGDIVFDTKSSNQWPQGMQ